MKTKILIIVAIFIMTGLSQEIYGQRPNRGQSTGCVIPDLTPEQESKINSLRTTKLNASLQHRTQMGELRARKQSLSLAEKPDMNAINNVIEQMGSLRTEHLKSNAQHRQVIREILTDEQRVYFDTRHANAANGGRMHNQQGGGRKGAGYGNRGRR